MSPFPRPRVLFSSFATIGIALFLSACQTPADSTSARQQSPDQAEAIRQALVSALKFGMRQSQVQSWLGEPKRVTPIEGEATSETWTYETSLPPTYKTIAIEIQEVPWVDPISGEMHIIREPLTGQQRVDGTEILTLTFVEGILHNIERSLDNSKTYSR